MTDHLKRMMRHTSGNSSAPKDIVSYEVALKSKKQIAEGTFAFVFEKPAGFQFKAGQHARVTLIDPAETDAEGNSRFFSFANTPGEADLMWAMRMTDTAFKRVLGHMEVGKKVLMQMRLNNPHGSFSLHDPADAARPAVFVIGGIGIVPAFSMIKDAIERKLPHTIYLFYSNRRPEDAPFLTELQQLAKQNSTFNFIATMTESEKSAKPWQKETGFITRAMIEKYVNELQPPIYYIAGLPEMVGAMKAMLLTAGIQQDSIRAEAFDGFKMDHANDAPANRSWKSHLLFVGVGLVMLAVVTLHVAGIVSVSHAGPNFFSFKNPLIYLMIGLMSVLVIFKFKHIARFLRGKTTVR